MVAALRQHPGEAAVTERTAECARTELLCVVSVEDGFSFEGVAV